MGTGVSFAPSLSRRFWGRVPIGRPDDCWPWAGARNGNGYGTIIGDDHRGYVATRLMREFIDGRAVPPSLCVCHRCDNPLCVNPNHLWIGTKRDNSWDMIAKGRKPKRRPLTRCYRGHPFTDENTLRERNGARRCRICRARRNKSFREI